MLWYSVLVINEVLNRQNCLPTPTLSPVQHPGPNEKSLHWHCDNIKRFPIVYRFWFGGMRPSVWVIHPQTAKVIAQTEEPKSFSGKGGYNFLLPWLGKFPQSSQKMSAVLCCDRVVHYCMTSVFDLGLYHLDGIKCINRSSFYCNVVLLFTLMITSLVW